MLLQRKRANYTETHAPTSANRGRKCFHAQGPLPYQTACCKSFLALILCTGSSCRSTDKSAVKCKQKMLARRLCAHSRCRGQPRSPHPPQSAPNILCRWTMRGLESAFIFKLGVAHLSPQRPPYTSGHTKLHPQLARAHLPHLFARMFFLPTPQ